MKPRARRPASLPARAARRGFVLLAVLFVLLALLVLCAPFLTTARNADRASGELADRASARIALDGAARHARARLSASHPGAPDETPWYDDLAEVRVDNDFDPEFLDANDPQGVMWDLEVEDVAGRIDLNSASPEVFANVIGCVTRLARPLGDESELDVYDPGLLRGGGFAFLEGELVQLAASEDGNPPVSQRGVGAYQDDEGEWRTHGPRPSSPHGAGAYVVDQLAHAPVVWRLAGAEKALRRFSATDQVRESAAFALAGALPESALAALADACSAYAGVRAGPLWQKPVRILSPIHGGDTHEIQVDDGRWLNPGATVWIQGPAGSELRYVLYRSEDRIGLDRVLDLDQAALEARASVLVRRPVNLNTASVRVLEALFANLKLAGYNSRITPSEARALAALVVESRPFTGQEDFLRRLVLPAAGLEPLPSDAPVVPDALAAPDARLIDEQDALALYLNGLNANDARLEFATMPFAFTSRDVYGLELRAAVNAESGIERTRALRERVELVVPQRELFTLWGTQADFDEELRLTRDARGWATGPEPTSRYDLGVDPPSRLWAHVGVVAGMPYLGGSTAPAAAVDPLAGAQEEASSVQRSFASRDPDGWAQLWPTRLEDVGRLRGHALHFDHETRDLEGRYLPEQRIALAAGDSMVAWAAASEGDLARPFSFSAWVRPDLPGDGLLLDLGRLTREADHASLGREGEDLVLRLLDGFGDHPATTEVEATELRYALLEGETPGLPLDTWSHVQVHSTGTRPCQTGMLVNGLAHGVRRLGLTRLTSSASLGAGLLVVESTEGFPARGPVRLGNEIVECRVASATSLEVVHDELGAEAGFGGRLARVRHGVDGVPLELGETTTDHPAGTTVEVYGYTALLDSGLPAGASPLADGLGNFRVAKVVGLDGQLDPILAGTTQTGGAFYYGLGYEALNRSSLMLAPADDPDGDVAETMRAFSPSGGYAAIVQMHWNVDGDSQSATPPRAPLGGVELIRYSGWSDNVLFVAARGDQVAAELPRYGAQDASGISGGVRVFVLDWESSTYRNVLLSTQLNWACYLVPVSLAVESATNVDFLEPAANGSELAQITRTDQAELTEWVRYDSLQASFGQLVRDSETALFSLFEAVTLGGQPPGSVEGQDPGGGGGGGGGGPPNHDDGGGAGGKGGGGLGGTNTPLASTVSAPPPSPPATQGQTTLWSPVLGQDELEDYPLTRAVWSQFQFRGVLGTFPHEHPAGTLVLPVFRVRDFGPENGRPGALDAVFAVAGDVSHVGWPLVVHRSHLASPSYEVHDWVSRPGVLVPGSGATSTAEQLGIGLSTRFVALTERCPEPIAPGSVSGGAVTDSRGLGRLVKWPSGERARAVTQVAVGGSFDGGGEVPALSVDEVVFDTPDVFFGLPGSDPPSYTQGAALILTRAVDDASTAWLALEGGVQAQGLDHPTLKQEIGALPMPLCFQIGEEIVCVESVRLTGTGAALDLAPGGRGLLGTRPQPHQPSELCVPLQWLTVRTLGATVSGSDYRLPLAQGLENLPARGLVLVDEELVQYTHFDADALVVPRGSLEPGAQDSRGGGLLRGRYGTLPAAHVAGTPVILFPQRYPDLWAERADVPELGYFGFSIEQPGAFWLDSFWDAEPAPHGQCRIGVLQRAFRDVPWDAEPDATEGLTLTTAGRRGDEALPLGVQSDGIDWRVFVRYDPGAFDLRTGLAHGWKETPRLRRLGVSYSAPNRVLSSVDR